MSVPVRTHMKEYLSFGAGVNSVALYLLLQEKGIDFEAIFVNHETDLPEDFMMEKVRKELNIKTVEEEHEQKLFEKCILEPNKIRMLIIDDREASK